jgi:hypothetical protein
VWGLYRAWRRSKKYWGTSRDHMRTTAQLAYNCTMIAILSNYALIGQRTGEWNVRNQVKTILEENAGKSERHNRNSIILPPMDEKRDSLCGQSRITGLTNI